MENESDELNIQCMVKYMREDIPIMKGMRLKKV